MPNCDLYSVSDEHNFIFPFIYLYKYCVYEINRWRVVSLTAWYLRVCVCSSDMLLSESDEFSDDDEESDDQSSADDFYTQCDDEAAAATQPPARPPVSRRYPCDQHNHQSHYAQTALLFFVQISVQYCVLVWIINVSVPIYILKSHVLFYWIVPHNYNWIAPTQPNYFGNPNGTKTRKSLAYRVSFCTFICRI